MYRCAFVTTICLSIRPEFALARFVCRMNNNECMNACARRLSMCASTAPTPATTRRVLPINLPLSVCLCLVWAVCVCLVIIFTYWGRGGMIVSWHRKRGHGGGQITFPGTQVRFHIVEYGNFHVRPGAPPVKPAAGWLDG